MYIKKIFLTLVIVVSFASLAHAESWVVCDGPLRGALVDNKTILPSGERAARNYGLAAACEEDKSSEKQNKIKNKIVTETLTFFGSSACNIWSVTSETPITPSQASEMANCFINTDFWKAYHEHGFGKQGTANGIVQECIKPQYNCSDEFIDVAINLASPQSIEIIDKPGSYNFSGYGANAKSVLVLPNIAGQVDITVSGHTQVNFQRSKNIKCTSLEYTDGCLGL